jgi:hypothetical protein
MGAAAFTRSTRSVYSPRSPASIWLRTASACPGLKRFYAGSWLPLRICLSNKAEGA